MDTTFIYFLRDPENTIRGYVGKTDNPLTRLPRHISECRKKTFRRATWINSLVARGLKPALEVIDEVPFEHWPQLEVAYIEFFLEQGYELVNATPGGEAGPVLAGEKNPQFGKKFSPEYCAKLSAAHVGLNAGEKHPMFGKKHKPESLAKMSASQKGKTRSPEACAKMSVARKGKKQAPETVAKRSAALTGRKLSPAHCEQIRQRMLGKVPPNKGKTGAQHPGFGKKCPGATSDFYGVYRRADNGKWRAEIRVDKKTRGLGTFADEIEAAKAYDAAAKVHHGEFAKLNFPD